MSSATQKIVRELIDMFCNGGPSQAQMLYGDDEKVLLMAKELQLNSEAVVVIDQDADVVWQYRWLDPEEGPGLWKIADQATVELYQQPHYAGKYQFRKFALVQS
jgi:hypothetical protein